MEKYSRIKTLAKELENDCGFYRKFSELECDPKKGIIPRALFLEERDKRENGCVLVGLNPGKATQRERNVVMKSKDKPSLYNIIWYRHRYHNDLRLFMDELGFKGSILWTELVKCQSKKRGIITLESIRKEFDRHLKKEINVVPKDWLLVGVGRKSYEYLSLLFPYRTVLGIPHPTGSWVFEKLFKKQENYRHLKDAVVSDIKEYLKEDGKSIFISVRKQGIFIE